MHNMYGLLEISATYAGLHQRSPLRPFVLTRSFFAGAQKYAAVWTGDTNGTWQHLELNLSMLQNLCACGVNFCGSDIPGFFGDPSDELLVRWYQAGVFFPFMRAHAHHETKRREPWLLSEKTRQLVSAAIHSRYELLPYIYTSYYRHAYLRSWPVMMPMWMAFPRSAELYSIENEYMFGPSLLVHPVCTEGAASAKVRLPAGELWYSLESSKLVPSGDTEYDVSDPASFPAFIRGGSIIPKYEFEYVSSTAGLKNCAVTLTVAPDREGTAEGFLYMDDGETLRYQSGEFFVGKFAYKSGTLTVSTVKSGYAATNACTKVKVLGVRTKPKGALLGGARKAAVSFDEKAETATIEFALGEANIGKEFSVTLEF